MPKIQRIKTSIFDPIQFRRIKQIIFALVFSLSGLLAHAESEGGGHGAPEGGGHEAPEGGGHGGAKKGEGEGGEGKKEGGGGGFIKKDEYLELKSAIEQLSAKIRSKNETLQKLLIDKDHAKDPQEFKGIVKQIETEYRELNELYENVEKKKAIVKYRFPERTFVKGDETTKSQRLEDIGTEAVIEKNLNSLINTVEGTYKMPIRSEAERERASREPANEKNKTGEPVLRQNPEDFSKSLILKK